MTACAALSKPTRRVLPPMVGLWRKRSDHHYLARPAKVVKMANYSNGLI